MTAEQIRSSSPASTAGADGRSTAHVRRIALLGPYASRNLGDTATQMAVGANLRRRCPDVQIVGVSPDPEDTLNSLGIPAFPLSGRGPSSGQFAEQYPGGASLLQKRRRHWPRIALRMARFVRSLDMLVVSGGGQLDDYWGGAFGHPWTMLLWTVLARVCGVPVVYLGVGLDRLGTPLSRRFAVLALQLAKFRSFRDAATQAAMHDLGVRGRSMVCPDLAFSLPLGEPGTPAPARRFAVINPISQKTWAHGQDERQEVYLQQLAETGAWLAARGLALRVVCSQTTMDGADARRLMQMLAGRDVPDVEVCVTPTVADYVAQVRDADVVIGARLHGVILALVAGSPVVALSPLPKVERVMEDAGLAQFCLPLQSFRTPDLIDRVALALSRVHELRAHIASVNAQFRAQLMLTLDEVVALMPAR